MSYSLSAAGEESQDILYRVLSPSRKVRLFFAAPSLLSEFFEVVATGYLSIIRIAGIKQAKPDTIS